LHWAFEQAAEQRQQLWVVYLDFANAFNSVDHEALWRWLRELNVPDVDLLRALYDQSYYVADLPYGQSAPIPLSRGANQGDKLSPLLYSLLFNCLLLALRATRVAHRTVSGLCTPARGFADDLVLCTESAEGMGRLLEVHSLVRNAKMPPAEAKVAVIQQDEPKKPRSSRITHDYAAMTGKTFRK
jgi:hypothetical protein